MEYSREKLIKFNNDIFQELKDHRKLSIEEIRKFDMVNYYLRYASFPDDLLRSHMVIDYDFDQLHRSVDKILDKGLPRESIEEMLYALILRTDPELIFDYSENGSLYWVNHESKNPLVPGDKLVLEEESVDK